MAASVRFIRTWVVPLVALSLFLRWVEAVRAADVAFTNLECQVFRMSEFKGWPAARSGGGYERGEPEVARRKPPGRICDRQLPGLHLGQKGV